MIKYPGIVLLAVLISFGTGCDRNEYHSISSISESWLEIKMDFSTINFGSANFFLNEFETRLDGFNVILNSFFSSPVAYLYEVNRPEDMHFLKTITVALDDLGAAAKSGSSDAVFATMLEIDSAIEQMLRIDTDFSNRSQLQYFQLFFFFSILVLVLIFVSSGLFSRLQIAKSREGQSLVFSRETVLALEHERERIARELHDTVAQDLWRLSFQVAGIGRAEDQEKRSELCTEVISEQKEIMQRIREICNSLIPPGFKHRGLENALRSLCHDFQQRSGIECNVSVEEDLRPLDIDRQLLIFRIVQECLTNIHKHSGASKASVIVHTRERETLVICVSDNGRGFSAPQKNSFSVLHSQGKLGLWSMSERAASMAGSLSLDSIAGSTMVTLRLPFRGAAS